MAKRQIIRIDEELCTGCGLCVPSCAEGALEIRDGKVRVVAEMLCDGLGACIGECPEGALIVEEREADEFDEAAVERRLEQIGRVQAEPEATHHHGGVACPGSGAGAFGRAETAEADDAPPSRDAESLLQHWPVQLTLVNPMAPFLRDADLLITADCAPVAYRLFHEDFLQGRSLVLACPKLDDAQAHMEKLAEIFQAARPRSVTVLRMEVPCCSGLTALTRQAAEVAGLDVAVQEVVLTLSGERQGVLVGR